MIDRARYYKLVEECVEYDRSYHTEGISLIPNSIYDGIRKLILEWEQANPNDVSANSPNMRVGEGDLKDYLTVHHGSKMLSIHSYHTVKEITRKLNEWYEMFGDNTVVTGEPKYDGNAGRIRYVDGVLEVGASRGDGEMGRDITSAIRRIVPETIDHPGWVEFIGEVVFVSKMFNAFNKWRVENGMDPVANERSAVSALLYGMKGFNSFPLHRFLTFVAFDVVCETITFKSRSDDMVEFIKSCGINGSSRYVCQHKESVDRVINAMIREYSARYTENNGLLLDGIVFKLDSPSLCLTVGATSTHPKWAYGYKFEPIGVEARVWKLDYTVGRSGVITPMVHVDPVEIAGVTVTKATLANASKVFKLDIRIGDTVHLYRGGDVIPQVGYVMKRAKPAGAKIEWPKNCPCCNSVLEEVGAKSYCRNADCTDRIIAQLTHFFGESGVEMPGTGEAIFERLVRSYGVKNAADVLRLTPKDLDAVEGGLGRAAKILLNKGILKIKKGGTLLRMFIYALGIPGVGAVTSTNLQCGLLHIDAFLNLSEKAVLERVSVPGVSKDTLKAVSDWLDINFSLVFELAKLIQPAYTVPDLRELTNTKIKDKVFVLSGEMPELRVSIKAAVEALGGKIADSVNKKTDALVVGDGPSDKKIKAAKKNKVPNITYADLRALMADLD